MVMDDMDDVTDNEAEHRRRFIAELRADNIARSAELDREITQHAFTRPLEHPIDRQLRQLAERDRRFAEQRERESASAPAATAQADWMGWETWLRARLDEERAFVLECVGAALGQALQKERAVAKRELSDEIKRLRIEITAADETIAELRRVIAADNRGSSGAEVIDLPASRRCVN